MRRILYSPEAWPDPPPLDTGISAALVRRVADGSVPETLRLHRPGRMVAFGPHDTVTPGFANAVAAAWRAGFGSVRRLAGGRAAVFHEQTIAFAWAIPSPAPRSGIGERFDGIAGIMRAALARLGVDARIGEVAGEYCPGAHSVNARGAVKLMGVGQRIVRRAAHVGGVLVVDDADSVRAALVPVYDALGLTWDPSTAGSVAEEVPGITWEAVREAIVDEFATRYELVPSELDDETVALGHQLATDHAL